MNACEAFGMWRIPIYVYVHICRYLTPSSLIDRVPLESYVRTYRVPMVLAPLIDKYLKVAIRSSTMYTKLPATTATNYLGT